MPKMSRIQISGKRLLSSIEECLTIAIKVCVAEKVSTVCKVCLGKNLAREQKQQNQIGFFLIPHTQMTSYRKIKKETHKYLSLQCCCQINKIKSKETKCLL